MTPPLELVPTGQEPGISSLQVFPDGLQSIGRDPGCDVQLAHPAISRRHAGIECRDGGWWVMDLGSRHGTILNGIRLAPEEPAVLRHGDSLALPPLVFRVDLGEGPLGELVSTMEGVEEAVERVHTQELGALAARRLDLLIDAAGTFAEARDPERLNDAVLTVLLQGTGLGRGAILRAEEATAERIQVVDACVLPGGEPRPYSRTLVAAALEGDVVRLNEEPALQEAVSIVGSGVQQAICAPVKVGDTVYGLLYVDAVVAGAGESDAAAFTAAIARLYGLSLANLKRMDLEVREEAMLAEMKAARMVQERLMPGRSGEVGGVSYVLYAKAGRVVAGDLFGIDRMHDGRVAVYLGDVAGKGAGAGMLMASIQAAIAVHLDGGACGSDIVARLNEYVAMHSASFEFATLFLMQLDREHASATIVDAGHGYALLIRDGEVTTIQSNGGPPIGAAPGMEYDSTSIELRGGDRVMVYSDGVAEQQNPEGEEFGVERVLLALQGSTSGEDDLKRVLKDMEAFAQSEHFADDVTVACVTIP